MASEAVVAQAGLFIMCVAEALNAYGALNSSPWTAENFGADPEKAKSCRQYVLQADIVNVALGIGTSLVSESPWPLVGMIGMVVYMHWTYEKALKKGAVSGSDNWAKS